MTSCSTNRTILVIDDDAQFRETLTQLLERDGQRVIGAANGIDGLAKAAAEHPDLIITDIMMPDMDGIEFATAMLRRNDPTPIIAMSGGWRSLTSELNLQAAAAMGVKATLAKPFSRDQLRATIRTATE